MVRTSSILFLFGLGLAASTGCGGSGRMQVDSYWNPSKKLSNFGSTFYWSSDQNSGLTDPALDKAVREEVEQAFTAKGYRMESQKPALRIRFFGRKYVQQAETGNESWEEGAFAIEVVDAADGGLIWRGTANAKLDYSAPADVARKRVREAVRKILENFPSKNS